MPERIALDVMRAAAGCTHCFNTIPGLEPVAQGVPKPRWIGSRYWTAATRVVVVLLNPGDSTNLGDDWNRREREWFEAFYLGGDYDQLRDYFRTRRNEEVQATTPARRVFSWYESTFHLAFEDIAQINVAWCASRRNQYRRMLRPCFERHTVALLKALEPHAVLLSGSGTHQFENAIKQMIPTVHTQTTIHYAHREGRTREMAEAEAFRTWFEGVRAGTEC
jgi:hypothetical protein